MKSIRVLIVTAQRVRFYRVESGIDKWLASLVAGFHPKKGGAQ